MYTYKMAGVIQDMANSCRTTQCIKKMALHTGKLKLCCKQNYEIIQQKVGENIMLLIVQVSSQAETDALIQ